MVLDELDEIAHRLFAGLIHPDEITGVCLVHRVEHAIVAFLGAWKLAVAPVLDADTHVAEFEPGVAVVHRGGGSHVKSSENVADAAALLGVELREVSTSRMSSPRLLVKKRSRVASSVPAPSAASVSSRTKTGTSPW